MPVCVCACVRKYVLFCSSLGYIFCSYICKVYTVTMYIRTYIYTTLSLPPFPSQLPDHSQVKETEKLLVDYVAEAKRRAMDEKVLATIFDALNSCQVEILPGREFPYSCYYDNQACADVYCGDCGVWHVTKGSCRSCKMADCPPQHATMSGSHLPVGVN